MHTHRQHPVPAERRKISKIAGALIAIVAAVLAATHFTTARGATISTSITIDGSKGGRTFDGVGAISGGGGNSRLLIDYPETQRNEILDYLFKPGYGAALQILKLEIGGDANTTDGSEPSIEHERGKINCDAGYEFWLAQEAKKRNPNIKLAGLTWAAPGWLNTDGTNNFYKSPGSVDYLVDWLGCAKSKDLTIDYLGGWNERYGRGGAAIWFPKLRSALDAKGYTRTKLVGGDDFGAGIANDMRDDAQFKDAVDIVGTHYACGGDQSANESCEHFETAIGLNKTIWASEGGSQDFKKGSMPVARAINRAYIDAKMTAFINWPIVASLYQNLVFSTDGLILADQPWSGSYELGSTLWSMAHTTQFTQPGWTYIDSASGYLGGARTNGSYVTLKSPGNKDYSTIIETLDAKSEQTASFTVKGLPADRVHVWSTDLKSFDPKRAFVKEDDVTPKAGSFDIKLKPGYVYTLTTSAGGGKGVAESPQRASFPKSHADDFESYSAGDGKQAKYLSAMNGAFEVVPCSGESRSGNCLRQEATGTPIRWTGEKYSDPYALLGDLGWDDYTVSSDVMLEQTGHVDVMGRVGQQGKNNNGLNAYMLTLTDKGEWSIKKSEFVGESPRNAKEEWKFTTLQSGTLSKAPGTKTWRNLALSFKGSTITAKVDGIQVGTATDSTYQKGMAGLGTGWINGQFDNFKVSAATDEIVNGDGSKGVSSAGTSSGSTGDPTSTPTGNTGTPTGTTGDPTGTAPTTGNTGDPTGSGGKCTDAAWDGDIAYQAGNVVSYNGNKWEAKWWTRGNEPGGATQWGAWNFLGTC